VQRAWYLRAIAVTVRAILCGLLSGGLIIALADTSDAAKGRGKSRRPSGYYYNSPTTASERQLRNQRAYERANTTNTTRTLCPSVPALGGNKKCARAPTNADSIGSREQSAMAIVEGLPPFGLRFARAWAFLGGRHAWALSKLPLRHCLQPFWASKWRGPFFACGGSHARRARCRRLRSARARDAICCIFLNAVSTRDPIRCGGRLSLGNRRAADPLPVKDRCRSNG